MSDEFDGRTVKEYAFFCEKCRLGRNSIEKEMNCPRCGSKMIILFSVEVPKVMYDAKMEKKKLRRKKLH